MENNKKVEKRKKCYAHCRRHHSRIMNVIGEEKNLCGKKILFFVESWSKAQNSEGIKRKFLFFGMWNVVEMKKGNETSLYF